MEPEEECEGEEDYREGRHDSIIRGLDQRMSALLPTGDKDYRKTYDEVFNDSTLKTIYRLFQRKVLDTLEYPISTGKEANVFLGKGKNKESVAVKIFRESTATFRKVRPYIEGDPRFKHILKGRRGLVEIWAKKEFKNLKRMEAAEVKVPSPIAIERNVLVMEYIGDEIRAAPTLRQWYQGHKNNEGISEEMERIYGVVGDNMARIHQKAGLVHSDLSEFNILFFEGEPVIIDVGQAVLLSHPMSKEFLERDVRNITAFFRKAGVDSTEEGLRERIVGSKKEE